MVKKEDLIIWFETNPEYISDDFGTYIRTKNYGDVTIDFIVRVTDEDIVIDVDDVNSDNIYFESQQSIPFENLYIVDNKLLSDILPEQM